MSLSIRMKKKMIITALVIFILGAIATIAYFYNYAPRVEKSVSESCVLGTSEQLCVVDTNPNNYPDETAVTLPIHLRNASGRSLKATVTVATLFTDETFRLSDGTTVSVLGSQAVSLPKSLFPQIDTIEQSAALSSFGVTTASADTPETIVVVPLVRSTDPAHDSSTLSTNPAGESSNSIAVYGQVDGRYVEIDLAWLGYFTLSDYQARSYSPPELRVLGTKVGQPFELILALDEAGHVRTSFSTNGQIRVLD